MRGGRQSWLRRRVRVQEDGRNDQKRAKHEHAVDVRVEKVRRGETGHDDGDRGGEAFQDVVGVFDDHGDEETSGALDQNVGPHEVRVAEEEAVLLDVVVVAEPAGDEREERAEHAELDVAHPDGHFGVFEDLFEVDARQAAQHARHHHAKETEQGALAVVAFASALNWK